MVKAKFTAFRARAKYYLGIVENGGTVRILRNGRPVADLVPVADEKPAPLWKRPGLKIKLNGISLSDEIIKDRNTARS